MEILQENLNFNKAGLIIEESTDIEKANGKKKLFMSGTCIIGGVKNLNERIYPVSEIRKAVDKINGLLEDNISVCGESDHPSELTINLDRITHTITKMWMDGNSGQGKLQILPTPQGEIIRTLIESGVKLGVSSRGSGNVDDRGNVTDFDIVTVDIVFSPSAPGAYPKVIYETRNSKRANVIEDLSRAVMDDPKAQKYLQKELLEWINNLKA